MDGNSLKLLFILGIASTTHSDQESNNSLGVGDRSRNLTLVNPSAFLGVQSHAGLIEVDVDQRLFYWYFPAENPSETPWIIWLERGAVSSSLNGLFNEVGPFLYEDGELKLRQNSWAKDYSMLFIDNPVGAGFSYTNDAKKYASDLNQIAHHLYIFLQKFLVVFPELTKPPLFLAGESSAVRYIAPLVSQMEDRKSTYNLEGIILGRPLINMADVANYTDFYLHMGLIDDQIARDANLLQDTFFQTIQKGDVRDYFSATKLFDDLSGKLQDISFIQNKYHILKDRQLKLQEFSDFVNKEDIKAELHVSGLEFSAFNETAGRNVSEVFLVDSQQDLEKILEKYRVLIYCGQFDLITPCLPLAEAIRNKWNWKDKEMFLTASRKPWWFNNTFTGYFKSGGRLTEVLVRGAGHMPTVDSPAAMRHLIFYFIRDLDLYTPVNYENDYGETWKLPYQDDDSKNIHGSKNINDAKLTPENPGEIKNLNKKVTENILGNYSDDSGLIISVIINVLLAIGLVVSIIYAVKWKRKHDSFMVFSIPEDYDDGSLIIDRY